MNRNFPFAKLLAEGVVIIGSVLIALSAQAWWEHRSDLEATRENLAGLALDFAQSDTMVSSRLVTVDAAVSAGEVLLRELQGPTPEIIADSALGLMARLLYAEGVVPTPSRAAYDALIETGRMELVQDSDLRRRLSEFYGSLDAIRIDEQMTRNMALQVAQSDDFVLEVGTQRLILAYADPRMGTSPDLVKRWSESSRLVSDLALSYATVLLIRARYQGMHQSIVAIRARLDVGLD